MIFLVECTGNTFIKLIKGYKCHHIIESTISTLYLQPVNPNSSIKQASTSKIEGMLQKQSQTIIYFQIKLQFSLIQNETLIHCKESLAKPSDIIFTIQVSPQEQVKAGINVRPGAVKLLELLLKYFELVVFTASHPGYAQEVIEYLDPQKLFFLIVFIEITVEQLLEGCTTRTLEFFNRSPSQVVLVDNASYSYTWQLGNGIPIIPFYDNKEDRKWELLLKYLKGLQHCNDVRKYHKNHLRLQYFQDLSVPGLVFERLFQKKIQI